MNIHFQIHYRAEYGQSLCVIETQDPVMGWTEKSPLVLDCQGTDFWSGHVETKAAVSKIYYKYAIRLQDGRFIYETGEPRKLSFRATDKSTPPHSSRHSSFATMPLNLQQSKAESVSRSTCRRSCRRKA